MDQPNPTPALSPIFDEINEEQREALQKDIRKCRNILFLAGGLMVLGDVLSMAIRGFENYNLPLVFGIDAAILAVFIGLGFLTRTRPYTAILSGLVAYLLIQVLVVAFSYQSDMLDAVRALGSGIIIKIYIVVTLIKGLRKGRELQDILEGKTTM